MNDFPTSDLPASQVKVQQPTGCLPGPSQPASQPANVTFSRELKVDIVSQGTYKKQHIASEWLLNSGNGAEQRRTCTYRYVWARS